MQRIFFWILVPVTLGLVACPWILPIFLSLKGITNA